MLIDDVTRYVALYRRLGRRFAEQSRTLHLFARFAAARGDSHIRVACVHDWCATPSSPNRARTCYDAVRRLAAFLNAEDPRHEVPPAGAFGRGKRPPGPAPSAAKSGSGNSGRSPRPGPQRLDQPPHLPLPLRSDVSDRHARFRGPRAEPLCHRPGRTHHPEWQIRQEPACANP